MIKLLLLIVKIILYITLWVIHTITVGLGCLVLFILLRDKEFLLIGRTNKELVQYHIRYLFKTKH